MKFPRLTRLTLLPLLCTPLFGAQTPDTDERFTTDRESPVELPLPEEDDSFVFAVFGDRTGGPADGVKILAQAVEDVNLIDPDLVMTVGDMIQGYNQTAEWQKQADEFTGIMNRLTSPWYPVAGNHDVYWRGDNRPETEHEENYERHFGPLWYAFRHKDCWFIILYTDEGDPETGEMTFRKPASQTMSPEQLAFLDTTLERTADARHVFVFLHHPRWRGGGYGDNWDVVHKRLAQAGNVTAVFAGHIHHMVYDGVRDGIEYFTLATVGGHTSNDAPEAGYLHHWNLVTVRDGKLAVSTIPVGAVIDPRLITDKVARAARTLIDSVRPKFTELPELRAGHAVDGAIELELNNPLDRPIEVNASLSSQDGRWTLQPDHAHLTIPAGESRPLVFHSWRDAGGFDRALRVPELQLQFDYLAKTHRVSLPARSVTLPILPVGVSAPAKPDVERALQFDGIDDCIAVSNKDLALPDGPFTAECRFNASEYPGRTGLFTKTQNAEFGIFLDGGHPSFIVHLNGQYVRAAAPNLELQTNRWYHIAGVYDGSEVRLYLDGEQIAATKASGTRTRLGIPLLVGADPDGSGRGTSFFPGRIDELRVSTGVRYTGAQVEPATRHEPDKDTRLLLHMDDILGTWVHDTATPGRVHNLRGQPRLVLRGQQ